jgi:hypothetical protein
MNLMVKFDRLLERISEQPARRRVPMPPVRLRQRHPAPCGRLCAVRPLAEALRSSLGLSDAITLLLLDLLSPCDFSNKLLAVLLRRAAVPLNA